MGEWITTTWAYKPVLKRLLPPFSDPLPDDPSDVGVEDSTWQGRLDLLPVQIGMSGSSASYHATYEGTGVV
jgi:hypothetical protein